MDNRKEKGVQEALRPSIRSKWQCGGVKLCGQNVKPLIIIRKVQKRDFTLVQNT